MVGSALPEFSLDAPAEQTVVLIVDDLITLADRGLESVRVNNCDRSAVICDQLRSGEFFAANAMPSHRTPSILEIRSLE